MSNELLEHLRVPSYEATRNLTILSDHFVPRRASIIPRNSMPSSSTTTPSSGFWLRLYATHLPRQARRKSPSSTATRNVSATNHPPKPLSSLRTTLPNTYCVVTTNSTATGGGWVMTSGPGNANGPIVLGTTEVVWQTAHPQWTTRIFVPTNNNTNDSDNGHNQQPPQFVWVQVYHKCRPANNRQRHVTAIAQKSSFSSQESHDSHHTTDTTDSTNDDTWIGSVLFQVDKDFGNLLVGTTRVKRLKHGGGCVFGQVDQIVQPSQTNTTSNTSISRSLVLQEEQEQYLILQLTACNLVLPHAKFRSWWGNSSKNRTLLYQFCLQKPTTTVRPMTVMGGSSHPTNVGHAIWMTTHRSTMAAISLVEPNKSDSMASQRNEDETDQESETTTLIEFEPCRMALDAILSASSNGSHSNNHPTAFLQQPIRIIVQLVQPHTWQTSHIGMAETTLSHLFDLASSTGNASVSSEVTSKSDTNLFTPFSQALEAALPTVLRPKTDKPPTISTKQRSVGGITLLTNELYLQRSHFKTKHVGTLRVLQARVESHVIGKDLPPLSADKAREEERFVVDVENDDSESEEDESEDAESIRLSGLPVAEIVDLAHLQPLPAPVVSVYDPAQVQERFQNYVTTKGLQLDLTVAIDFTSSNGNPQYPSSLHYQDPNTYNDYEETIVAIGKAIENVNATAGGTEFNRLAPQYKVIGFGAKFGSDNIVRHLFQCGSSPTVPDVTGILQAYQSMFQSGFTMSGPTILTQVLQAAAMQAKRNHTAMTQPHGSRDLRYNVLLIVTDGMANEFEETQRKLSVYSSLPLSIVIVGVGGHDETDGISADGFARMYQLCTSTSADQMCNASFVEFRHHQYDPMALGSAALQQLTLQVCNYMDRHGL